MSGNIQVMTNFSIPSAAKPAPAPPEYLKPQDTFRVLFAGNVGRFQALDNVIEAAKLLSDKPEIHLTIVGEGAAKASLIRQAGDLVDRTVFFVPHQPVNAANELMQDADICLVSLSPDIFRVANPCKASSYMALGCPVLAVIEPESHLFQMVEDNGLGFACGQADPAALRDKIMEAFDRRSELDAMGSRARTFAEQQLTGDALMPEWRRLINELTAAEPVPARLHESAVTQ